MSRKLWLTESWPGAYELRHPSMKQAYEYVRSQRLMRLDGRTRTESITVKVNEGHGWRLYERLQIDRPSPVEQQ